MKRKRLVPPWAVLVLKILVASIVLMHQGREFLDQLQQLL
jgi:hypothetical protein